eukprot:CAMPEP_0179434248 /NCGR_PEP_ID=MMETSP0799-20121207/18570_1 /TAXON_ID=46947 /ORGANISM="Geminigera cryophila, Strain CCMP2564" /LENGTH=35 /DNA_ID= /DNA_START= /DNA_END= /DNA_ORIENTATION=
MASDKPRDPLVNHTPPNSGGAMHCNTLQHTAAHCS